MSVETPCTHLWKHIILIFLEMTHHPIFTYICYFPLAPTLITSFVNSRPILITAFITDCRDMCLQVSEGFIEIIT